MTKSKQKIKCKYCGKMYTKSGIQNHEKHCPENPKNKKEETPEVLKDFLEEQEDITEESVTLNIEEQEVEIAEVKIIKNTEAGAKKVKIKIVQNLYTYIGDRYYNFKAGEVYEVPENVKRILNKAGMLKPI